MPPSERNSALLRAQSARAGIAVTVCVIAMVPLRLVADERFDAAALDAIIAEAEQSSEAAEIFYIGCVDRYARISWRQYR